MIMETGRKPDMDLHPYLNAQSKNSKTTTKEDRCSKAMFHVYAVR